MVVEERISGTLCRVHLDENDARYSAQWILTDAGEISGLMIVDRAPEVVKEFGAWILIQKYPIKIKTAVRGVQSILKRFGFVEMERK